LKAVIDRFEGDYVILLFREDAIKVDKSFTFTLMYQHVAAEDQNMVNLRIEQIQ